MGHYITSVLTCTLVVRLFFFFKFGEMLSQCVCVGVRRVSMFDYQAMCKMNLHSVSGTRPLLSVSTKCLC